MFKTVLWIAAACAAVLVALAVSRTLNFDKPVEKAAEPAPAAVAPPPPPVEAPKAAEVAPPPPPPVERTPEQQQIDDDAAATGMTTVEPDPPTEAPR
jgi:hypothetical protein